MAVLPIDSILPALRANLARMPNLVLQAPPGAGKTTHVPLGLLGEPWLGDRSILILEPRRLAARAAAARMADLLGETVGGTIGYRVRFDTKVSKRTRIEVLTEGILTRRLQSDPELRNVGLVIFDEFHERHLQTDLALALALDVQRGLREDLRILVMSATLDAQPIAGLLDHASVLTSEGRQYPVDLRYALRDPQGPIAEVAAAATRRALAEQDGDVLVFLPGGGEIRRTQELLSEEGARGIRVCPLYGDLSKEAQDQAIQPDPDGRRKVVLATPIAETSLTIEGVRVVVDAGYARLPRFDPVTGLTRLETVRIAKASADQRAGRAGRLAPGVCYRLWSETTQRGLVPRLPPEILSVDLAGLVLDLACWGVQDPRKLAWLDAPPSPAWAQAVELLRGLDAIDSEGRIMSIGQAMAELPLHPRLAHMLRRAQPLGLASLACDLAALLSERDIFARDRASSSCDLTDRVEALMAFRDRGRPGAQSCGADGSACARVERASQQWRRLLNVESPTHAARAEDVGLLLAFAYPDRIAEQREAGSVRYRLANGKGVRLVCEDRLITRSLLVAASLDAGRAEGKVFLAAPVQAEALRSHLGAHISQRDSVFWNEQEQSISTSREERLGEVVLARRPLGEANPVLLQQAMLDGVRRLGIEALPWTREARDFQARVLSLRHWFPDEDWPDISDATLADTFDDWLAPYLAGITRRDHLARLDMTAILQSQLEWQQRQRLDELAPTHIAVPSGAHHRLQYTPGQAPVLAVKLQEMFGLADTPRVAAGRIAVILHLLSPAQRPIQVTQDLCGFWERTYGEVKKELKGRYPKHPWPDDPWKAVPTAKTRRRTSSS